MLNSVISILDARFMNIDISNFYLNTPMTRYEYLKLNICNFPDKIINLITCARRKLQMKAHKCKSKKACTDYPKQDSSIKSYSKIDWQNTNIPRER